MVTPVAAQPTEWQPLASEVYELDLSRIDNNKLPWLLEAHSRAEGFANRGQPGADKLLRYVTLLRQLAQVQESRLVTLRTRDGRVIGDRAGEEANRLRDALVELRAAPRVAPSRAPRTVVPAPRRSDLPSLLNRELSFLAFNERVLDLAKDARLPLQERVAFLTIVSGNMDEFFQIRVSGLKEEVRFAVESRRSDGFTARETLPKVIAEAQRLAAEQYRVYESLLPALEAEGIRVASRRDLRRTPATREWAETYVTETALPKLQPVDVDPNQPFPRLVDKSLNLLVAFDDGRKAVVQIPKELKGMIAVPGQGDRLVLATDVIEENVGRLFPGRTVSGVTSFRVTRNHDLWGRTGIARRFGDAVRLEVPKSADPELREYLRRSNGLSRGDVYAVEGPVDLARVGDLRDVERPGLAFERHTPVRSAELPEGVNMFEAIRSGERLLHHPFESYQPVVELIDQAARDAKVTAIKQTLYRTGGSNSPIVDALVLAAESGKEVTVLVETRARFDELNNVENVRRLREAGAKVIYGPPGLKTHAKLLSIERMEGNTLKRYVHMGTGNYNHATARFYTDFSLFSADPVVGADVEKIFRQLSGESPADRAPVLDRLLMAPYTLKSTILERIRAETANATAGREARIVAKMNSLNDPEIIKALYEASQAGVKVDLIVRGLTTVRAGVPGLSENIRVRSILGRFLEHTRVFEFHDGGKRTTYLGSADWMVRNTERRVETAIRVDDPRLKAKLHDVLDAYMRDNTMSWELKPDGRYERLQPNGRPAFSVQDELLARSAATERAAPLDRLEAFRRADRTVDWKAVRESRVTREALGLAHFGLALFLKEVAVVAATGDRLRIEEFFDTLATTDFYKHYGLFVAGARLSEVAYTKFLQGHIRKTFINGLLKTNIVLAAGLALPMIAEGHFSGKALVITLGSLGLSSAAVRTGVAGLRWVTGLDTARRSGTLARFGIRAGKFANVAGWVYTAAELAVILYVAEKIEHTVNAALELKNAREDLRDASRDVLAALDADTPSEASVEAATRAYHESWIAFRNLLYRPLDMDEALFAQRLAKVAREAKLLEDTRSAAVRRVNSHEGLTSSLERYIDTKARGDHAELSREINRAFEAYTLSRSEHLAEVYEGNVRGTRFLLSSRASGDARLIEAHGDASKNRLESYDDEAAVLAAFAWRARRAGHPELAETFERTRALTLKTRDMDRELFEGGDSVVDVSRPTFDRALGAGR